MSQIEIVMSVALGFAAALLVALLVGRLIWSYAVRLGRRRIERSGPAAMQELQADRDRLRAEYAMLSRRLEMRLDDLKTRLAEQTAEVSRHRNRIDQLAADLKAKEDLVAQREAEIHQLKEQIEPLEAELATRTQALQQAKEQLREREQAESELDRELAEMRAGALDRQRQLAGGEFQFGHVRAEGDVPGSHDRVRSRIEELSALARQIETQRRDLLREHAELKALKVDIARSQRRKRKSTREKAAPTPVDAAAHVNSERFESLDSESRKLETTLAEAEREADKLQGELKELDAVWTARLAEISLERETGAAAERATAAPAPVAVTGEPEPLEPALALQRSLEPPIAEETMAPIDAPPAEEVVDELAPAGDAAAANVITLANRIRALQRGVRG